MLIAALGGQGGGVLADWLVAAARIEKLQAQATSIPGVAQRTGATTYYFEVYPQKDLAGRPVFSIFPASGAIDLMVSFEPMEAARALSAGYISQATAVITARERIYSTYEKLKPGNGVTAVQPVFDALANIAGKLRVVEMRQAAHKANCHPNAVMFGAMVASGVLPMGADSCREAISHSGVAVENNLAGFRAGMELAHQETGEGVEAEVAYYAVPQEFASEVDKLPKTMQQLVGHAATQLLDYQDAGYVAHYFEILNRVVAEDGGDRDYRLSHIVAQRLAAWMSFEDIIRVAQLKTRPGRLSRIRNELGITADMPLIVDDYLKPGREELRGILPKSLGKWVAPAGGDGKDGGLTLKINTAGPIGWGLMRFLSKLKGWRPHSIRFAEEMTMITRWIDVVVETTRDDYQLACQMAELAVWARGYGDTRKRGFSQLDKLLGDFHRQVKTDKARFATMVAASLAAAGSDRIEELVG